MIKTNGEVERIKEVYKQRKATIPEWRYSFLNPAQLFIYHSRQFILVKLLRSFGITSLSDKKILEIGCGSGNELRNLMWYGAVPQNQYGIDILEDDISIAKEMHPSMNFICGDASQLPYEDASFDIVMQNTVFTSVLDEQMRIKMAREMLRVLKNNGMILWYDFCYNNPANSNVRGVSRKEIKKLFSGCNVILRSAVLAPPIVRALAPFSIAACYLLSWLKIFNTHCIGIIRKDESA